MVDINGRPVLDIPIKHISSFRSTRFILCVGHKSQYIEYYYREKLIVSKCLILEKIPLGNGGALKNAEHLIQSECFFVLNGDSFSPVALKEFYEFHQRKKAQFG
jgi:NDP-sugar pyrophosphorylase family protein